MSPDKKVRTEMFMRILETASRVFHERGFAIGVDTIVSESAVAKMSLYRHFPSKEELILTVLAEAHARLVNVIDANTREGAEPGANQVSTVVIAICKSMRDPQVRGSLTTQALTEFPHRESAVHQAACANQKRIADILEGVCGRAGLKNAKKLSEQLVMVIDGCFTMQAVFNPPRALHVLRETVVALLRAG